MTDLLSGLSVILKFGTVPTLVALIVLIWNLRQEVRGRLQRLEAQIDYIKDSYLKKSEFFEDFSGWRQELRYLGQELRHEMKEIKKEFYYFRGFYDGKQQAESEGNNT